MKIRFQADADLNHIIVLALLRRERDIDFRTASAAELAGVGDADVLDLAARDGRLLVTHDQSTMPVHFGRFIASRASPGLIVVPQHLPPAKAAEELLLVWSATEAEEWANQTMFLPL